MSLKLVYWEEQDKDTHLELKHVVLKSIDEAFPLALAHNRPSKTALITLERYRNYKGNKWIDERIVWERTMDYPVSPIKQIKRTKGRKLKNVNS